MIILKCIVLVKLATSNSPTDPLTDSLDTFCSCLSSYISIFYDENLRHSLYSHTNSYSFSLIILLSKSFWCNSTCPLISLFTHNILSVSWSGGTLSLYTVREGSQKGHSHNSPFREGLNILTWIKLSEYALIHAWIEISSACFYLFDCVSLCSFVDKLGKHFLRAERKRKKTRKEN